MVVLMVRTNTVMGLAMGYCDGTCDDTDGKDISEA